MNRMFVLFVNDHGFIGDNGQRANNVTKAHVFDSREMAELHRKMIYD